MYLEIIYPSVFADPRPMVKPSDEKDFKADDKEYFSRPRMRMERFNREKGFQAQVWLAVSNDEGAKADSCYFHHIREGHFFG